MVLLPGVIPRPVTLDVCSAFGGPVIRVGNVDPDREGRFALNASYIYFWDRLDGEDDYRLFFLTLEGEIGLMTQALPLATVENFRTRLHDFGGWFCIELELPDRVLRLCCDGYLDFSGTFPLAIEALHGGDGILALNRLRELLEQIPRLKYTRVLLYLLLRWDNPDLALQYLKDATAFFSWDPGILTMLANALAQMGEPRRASVFYRRALMVSPFQEVLLQRIHDAYCLDQRLKVPQNLLVRLARLTRSASVRQELEKSGIVAAPLSEEACNGIMLAEMAGRKGAFAEAMRQVEVVLNKARKAEITILREWAAEFLSCIPERLPPFVMPGLLGEMLRLLMKINPDREAGLDLHLARFIDAVVIRYGIGMGHDDRGRLLSLQEEMHERHAERAEFSSYPVRTLFHLAEDAVSRGEMAEAESLWQRLRGFIERDPSRLISTCTAITLLTRQLDELFGCPCRGNNWRQIVIGRVWALIQGLIDETLAFAHITPLLLLIKRWHSREDSEPMSVKQIVADLKKFRDRSDPSTTAMIQLAMEKTQTAEYFN